MIRKPAHKDTVNPPGQVVNRPPTHVGTLRQEIQDFLDTEEAFTPAYKVCDCPGKHSACIVQDPSKKCDWYSRKDK